MVGIGHRKQRRGIPSSAIRVFTDPDQYFSGIRNLQIDGVILPRGKFRAASTRMPFRKIERASATAAYEQDDEAAPNASAELDYAIRAARTPLREGVNEPSTNWRLPMRRDPLCRARNGFSGAADEILHRPTRYAR